MWWEGGVEEGENGSNDSDNLSEDTTHGLV